MKIKSITPSVLILFVLGCLALCQAPNAFAVVPPPDGGYPNFNTAEGTKALQNLTTGAANAGVGWYSLFSNGTGSFNTGVGAGTLVLNTGDENTAIGAAALLLNTASGNTAVGSRALLNNTTGGTLGTIQDFDVGPNVAVGAEALQSNTVASANTAVGYQALGSITTGVKGSDLGASTAVGFQALANATGALNDAFGYQALFHLTDGVDNVAVGFQALFGMTTGFFNVALGNSAGPNITAGTSDICIGAGAGSLITTASNVIAIGASGDNVENSCFIGNIFGQPVGLFGVPVLVDNQGKLGTILSSRRFKKDIEPMDRASEAILSLKPVRFHYKSDTTNTPQFGLVAEEVAEVNPDLVVRDRNGEIYTVRYEQVNAMLLNEFLKEHNRVEELKSKAAEQDTTIENLGSALAKQEATITQLRNEMKTIVAQLKEQNSTIQKVSAQINLKRPVARVAGTISH
jgi:uncharacterized coiled-coil protein SlyX